MRSHTHTVTLPVSELGRAECSPHHKRCVRSLGRFVILPTSPTFRVPCPPTSFAARQDIKQINTLPVIFLFHACLQTLGPSREHKRDEGKAPGVQGPATNILAGPLKPSVRGSRNVSTTARVLILSVSLKTRVPNTSANGALVLYMFSFSDARKVHN